MRDSFTAPPAGLCALSAATVRRISNDTARQIILKYEWLGTMGTGTECCYGLMFGIHCGGAAAFTHAASIILGLRTLIRDGLKVTEGQAG